jgi:ketosteroid isomerase-like protein
MTTAPELIASAMSDFYDALARRDLDAAMAAIEGFLHVDCELVSVIGSEIEGRTYRGAAEVRGWFANLLDSFDVRYEDRDYRVISEGLLLLLCTNKLRGRASGVDVSRDIGVVWWIEDGLVRSCRSYGSHAEALSVVEAARA